MPIKTIDPKSISTAEIHGILLSTVVPRPIAFASTIDENGEVNLSPFSFFNVFSANPPVLIFSPSRRGRDNTTKHTYDNVRKIPEVAISIVNYSMVQQMSLASSDYPQGVNEFIKAGFTEAPSEIIKPPYVSEAPASFECRVNDIIPLGEQGGAGNLVICEVVRIHLDEAIFDEEGKIDPQNLDAVARMGGNWYCRAQGDAIFEVPKPLSTPGIGIDRLPEHIRYSSQLSGNELGILGSLPSLPGDQDIINFKLGFEDLGDSLPPKSSLVQIGKLYLEQGDVTAAYCAFTIALNEE